jgi:hypothetical protein
MSMNLFRALGMAAALAAVTGAAPSQDKTLAGRQAAFVKGIQEGMIKEAYVELVEGSLILEKKDEIENLITQTVKGTEIYGGVTAVDNLGVVRQEKHVAHGQAIVACEKAPLYFYFIWYRNKADAPWRIQSVWFDDNSKFFMEHRK